MDPGTIGSDSVLVQCEPSACDRTRGLSAAASASTTTSLSDAATGSSTSSHRGGLSKLDTIAARIWSSSTAPAR
ncbi:MAG: hypothetical protein ACRYG2_27950 [Janthinobacterium lividum]